jgi:hypothetical protein
MIERNLGIGRTFCRQARLAAANVHAGCRAFVGDVVHRFHSLFRVAQVYPISLRVAIRDGFVNRYLLFVARLFQAANAGWKARATLNFKTFFEQSRSGRIQQSRR